MNYVYFSSIGQDSHKLFDSGGGGKPLRLAGLNIPCEKTVSANSDGDVLFHAVTNAVSGRGGVNVLGETADKMCRDGLTDSRLYLEEALKQLNERNIEIVHLSVSIEALIPKLSPYIERLRKNTASVLGIPFSEVCVTATTGEGLTSFGSGQGIQVLCILSARRPET